MTATIERKITKIPVLSELPTSVMSAPALRRAAGYARVSTNEEEQKNSYAAQVDYYTKMIQGNPAWEFCGVYTDEGISGTSTKKRDGFNQMVQDALDGKLDLIVTKSVSRFARNTVDSLQTVRALKEKGVEIFFEEQNIWTLDSKGELLITILSSLAQEEARNISENVTWGKRRAFEAGKFSLPYKQFLGYERGEDGLPIIVEEEAEIVRLIYRLFLYGKSASHIANLLTDEGIPTPGGKTTWRSNVVISILQNEKYAGNALLQKKYTTDFLSKAQKVNEGEVPQFYVENSHPAIIEPELFELVQHEFQRRAASGKTTISTHPLSGKIFCADCGGLYGPRVQHSTSQYRRVVWRCNHKYARGEKGVKCPSKSIKEEDIQAAFIAAFNRRLNNRAAIFAAYDEVLEALTDTTALDAEAETLIQECEVVTELTRKAVLENAQTALDQADYDIRYSALLGRYEAATARLAEIDAARTERRMKFTNMSNFLQILKQQERLVDEFDEELWYITVDRVMVCHDGRLDVIFRDGATVGIQKNT